jgi:hypothetical protein
VYSDVPVAFVNSARSDLETFAEVCDFVETVAADKLAAMGEDALTALADQVSCSTNNNSNIIINAF